MALAGSRSTRALPTRAGSASRPSRPACHSPAVWKQSSTSRGAVISGSAGGLVVVGKRVGQRGHGVVALAPGRRDHLIRGAVEVERVHLLRAIVAAPVGSAGPRGRVPPAGRHERAARVPVKCTVRCGSACPGSMRSATEPGIGDEVVAVGAQHRLHA